MQRGRSNSISNFLSKMAIVPILFLGIIVAVFGYFWLKSSVERDIQGELSAKTKMAYTAFDAAYRGDFTVDFSGGELIVKKGDNVINARNDLLDSLSDDSNTDYTLFLRDVRILTTLTDNQGVRLIGTEANPQIIEDVFKTEKDKFYKSISVFGASYYAYYAPIFDSKNQCVGMIASLTLADRVYRQIRAAALPLISLVLAASIFTMFWTFRLSKAITLPIKKLQGALLQVTQGTLSNTVPPELLSRRDELGQIAHSVVDMQAALRKLIDEDMLTGLSNRRSGQLRLDQLVKGNQTFCIALGDIDFFKKFNDTYGHDCGDYVLQSVASLLQKQVKDYGICYRWGGEEFLFIFHRGTFDEIHSLLEQTREAVRRQTLTYQHNVISVTMTFGLISSESYNSIDNMLKAVDNLMYYGKTHGRDCITIENPHDEKNMK